MEEQEIHGFKLVGFDLSGLSEENANVFKSQFLPASMAFDKERMMSQFDQSFRYQQSIFYHPEGMTPGNMPRFFAACLHCKVTKGGEVKAISERWLFDSWDRFQDYSRRYALDLLQRGYELPACLAMFVDADIAA